MTITVNGAVCESAGKIRIPTSQHRITSVRPHNVSNQIRSLLTRELSKAKNGNTNYPSARNASTNCQPSDDRFRYQIASAGMLPAQITMYCMA